VCPLYRASRDATILREAAVPNSVVKQLLCRVVDLGLVEEGLVPLTTSLLHAVSTVLLDMILSTLIREEGNKEHPFSLLFQIIFQSSLPVSISNLFSSYGIPAIGRKGKLYSAIYVCTHVAWRGDGLSLSARIRRKKAPCLVMTSFCMTAPATACSSSKVFLIGIPYPNWYLVVLVSPGLQFPLDA